MRKKKFVTRYPAHHGAIDAISRKLAGSSQHRLLAKANKLLGEALIENETEKHTVLDDRAPAEMIGSRKN